MKKIVQVLGSVIYTFLFSAIMYLVTVFPIVWFIGLSTFWKIVTLLFFAGFLQGLIGLIQTAALLPYGWLLKGNAVATFLSIGILIVNIIVNIVNVWKNCLAEGGFWMVSFAVTVSILLVEIVAITIPIMANARNEN